MMDLTGKEFIVAQQIKDELNKKKGLVCREFEKICPTEASFKRMVKEMHNIFDTIETELFEVILKKDQE